MSSERHFLLIYILIIFYCFIIANAKRNRAAKSYNQTRPNSKYDNPNFIRDRYHDNIWKPMMPEAWVNRFNQPFHPAWMDYCDPYHCNDYHKTACGLNRRNMRFKWFQSACHIILNNMCANYLGALRYDVVDTKYCSRYVMFLRFGCPSVCPDKLDPICGVSTIDNQVVMFMNKCAMERANCEGNNPEEFVDADMKICEHAIENISK